MNKTSKLDVRGLPCPQPVIQTRNAMKTSGHVTVLVSQADQADNVKRMAERSGWTVERTQLDSGEFQLELNRDQATGGEPVVKPEDLVCGISSSNSSRSRIVVLQSDTMGSGDDALGTLLMKAYVNTLCDLDMVPETIVMFNAGVKLAVTNSPVLDALRSMEIKGVEILVCGTCLDFFNLKEDRAVGTVSNMFDIAETMMKSGNTVIS